MRAVLLPQRARRTRGWLIRDSQRLLGRLDSGLNIGLPIQVRNWRSLRRAVKAQSVLRAVQRLQRNASRREQRKNRLPLLRIRLRELVVLAERTINILLPFENAAKLEPSGRGHAVPAAIQIVLIVLHGGFLVL